MAEYKKLQAEDREHESEVRALETAVDYRTVENRQTRKAPQERRNAIAKAMEVMGATCGRASRRYRGSIRAWRRAWSWRNMRGRR